jgi:hypothetical protein
LFEVAEDCRPAKLVVLALVLVGLEAAVADGFAVGMIEVLEGSLRNEVELAGDTVEVTEVDFSALGHGYYAQARGVMEDMYGLLWQNLPPHERFALSRINPVAGEAYWTISG